MNAIVWVIAYSEKSKTNGVLSGFLKDPDYFFGTQEEAHAKKHDAFKILYTRGAVKDMEQLTVVPLNELGVKIQ